MPKADLEAWPQASLVVLEAPEFLGVEVEVFVLLQDLALIVDRRTVVSKGAQNLWQSSSVNHKLRVGAVLKRTGPN